MTLLNIPQQVAGIIQRATQPFGEAPDNLRFKVPDYKVYVKYDFPDRPWFHHYTATWSTIYLMLDGADSVAEIQMPLRTQDISLGGVPAPQGVGRRHFDRLLRSYDLDVRILIADRSPGGRVLFEGIPVRTTASWNNSQMFTLHCVSTPDLLSELHNKAQIWGRYMRKNPAAEYFFDDDDLVHTDWPLHFNPPDVPNRSADPIMVEIAINATETMTVPVYYFVSDNDPNAKPWTVVQALIYLLNFHYSKELSFTVDRFFKDVITLASEEADSWSFTDDPLHRLLIKNVVDLRLDATNLRSALLAICKQAGLHMHFPTYQFPVPDDGSDNWEHSLRIFPKPSELAFVPDPVLGGNMIQPRELDVPRDPPFVNNSNKDAKAIAQANPTQGGNLNFHQEGIRNTTFLGGRKNFELTLNLRPGWLPFTPANSSRYGTTVPPFSTSIDPNPANVVDDVADIDDAIRYWDDALRNIPDLDNPDQPQSPFITDHPDHKKLADVLRLWVFPTDYRRQDDYLATLNGATTYARNGYPADMYNCIEDGFSVFIQPSPKGCGLTSDFTGGSGAKDWVAAVRPIRQLIGRNSNGGTKRPLLQAQFTPGGPWVDLTKLTEFEIMQHECGIRINHPNLTRLSPQGVRPEDDNFVYSYLRGELKLRITCTIEGDQRVVEKETRSLPAHRETGAVFDAGEKFQFHDPDSGNSIIDDDTNDNNYSRRNAQRDLQRHASFWSDALSQNRLTGHMDIFWIQPWNLGDRIKSMKGINLDWKHYSLPETIGVQFNRQPASTKLILDYEPDAYGGPR